MRISIAVMLMAVIVSSIATSSARFVTIISSNGSARAAAWWVCVEFDSSTYTSTFNISLASTATDLGTTRSTKVAPGSSGSMSFYIDCTNCETDLTWSITLTKATNGTYPAVDFTTEFTGVKTYLPLGTPAVSGSFTYAPATKSDQHVTVDIDWVWPLNLYVNDNEFADDDYVYIATIVAEQTMPS